MAEKLTTAALPLITDSRSEAFFVTQVVRSQSNTPLFDKFDPIFFSESNYRSPHDLSNTDRAVPTVGYSWRILKPNGKCHSCGALLDPRGRAATSIRFCSMRCIKFHIRWVKNIAILDALGGKCAVCGNNDIRCLEKHHKNPKTKKIKLCLSGKRSNIHLFELLCSNCHNIKTWNQLGSGMTATIIKQRLKSNGKR